jgi:hypothetical protein
MAGCSSFQSSPQSDIDKAVELMSDGYTQLGKVANNLDMDQMDSARKHFNSALSDFDASFEYFAKASLPADDKPALDNLKKGFSELEKCVKALERNDLNQAQTDYDNAQLYFSRAAILLD